MAASADGADGGRLRLRGHHVGDRVLPGTHECPGQQRGRCLVPQAPQQLRGALVALLRPVEQVLPVPPELHVAATDEPGEYLAGRAEQDLPEPDDGPAFQFGGQRALGVQRRLVRPRVLAGLRRVEGGGREQLPQGTQQSLAVREADADDVPLDRAARHHEVVDARVAQRLGDQAEVALGRLGLLQAVHPAPHPDAFTGLDLGQIRVAGQQRFAPLRRLLRRLFGLVGHGGAAPRVTAQTGEERLGRRHERPI